VRGAYPSLYARLVANTHEPTGAHGCWIWARKRDRWGYGRVNVYVPGLRKVVTLMAHVALWVWLHAECTTADELYLAYQELQASGLELDHLCREPSCTAPDHFEPVTGAVNCQRKEKAKTGVFTYR
jgi:hypothetical protein